MDSNITSVGALTLSFSKGIVLVSDDDCSAFGRAFFVKRYNLIICVVFHDYVVMQYVIKNNNV